MSGTDHDPADVLVQRLRFGHGFHEVDEARVVRALANLGKHLAHWEHDQVDLHIAVKDRDGVEQKVTLEARLPGLPALVATSNDPDLDHALVVVRKELARQVDDAKTRREPNKHRAVS